MDVTFAGRTESTINEDKKFDKLYTKHEEAWRTIVWNTFSFAENDVARGGESRPDEHAEGFLLTPEVNEQLRH